MQRLFLHPPPSLSCRPRNSRPGLRCHFCCPRFPTSAAELCRRRFDRIDIIGFLAGRDPHDADGVADYVGGALLSLGAARHQRSIPYCAISFSHLRSSESHLRASLRFPFAAAASRCSRAKSLLRSVGACETFSSINNI